MFVLLFFPLVVCLNGIQWWWWAWNDRAQAPTCSSSLKIKIWLATGVVDVVRVVVGGFSFFLFAARHLFPLFFSVQCHYLISRGASLPPTADCRPVRLLLDTHKKDTTRRNYKLVDCCIMYQWHNNKRKTRATHTQTRDAVNDWWSLYAYWAHPVCCVLQQEQQQQQQRIYNSNNKRPPTSFLRELASFNSNHDQKSKYDVCVTHTEQYNRLLTSQVNPPEIQNGVTWNGEQLRGRRNECKEKSRRLIISSLQSCYLSVVPPLISHRLVSSRQL